ncbi:MAG TPA: GAF domain-containing protein, partial [Thermoplasmata archaeon]|nr:GAF domain-containing protein [Thermoplasmata archaeon]
MLKGNVGLIAENWFASFSRSSYLKGKDFGEPETARLDRMKVFVEAIIERAEDPESKKAHEVLKSSIRADTAKVFGFTSMVKKQNLLRDVMLYVVEHDLPDLSRATAKLAIDAMIDKSIEDTVMMLEEYGELRGSIAACMPGAPDSHFVGDQGLSRICRNLMDYFEVDFVALFTFRPPASEFVCEACSAKGVTLTKGSTVLLDSFPIGADAVREKTIKLIGNGKEESSRKRKVLGRLTFDHSMAVPLVNREEVIGLILLGDSSKVTMFTPEEVGLMEDIAAFMTWMMSSTDLLNKLSTRSKAQKALIDTAAALQQEISSEEIYRIVATKLLEIVPSKELAFYVYDWVRRIGNPVYATGPYASEIMMDREFNADLGFAGYVARTRKAEIILDSEADPRGSYIQGTPNTHTRMLVVPVIGQREVLGVIELFKYLPDTFSQEDLEAATMFANHASVALENAKLLTELRHARDQIEVHMDLLTHDIANYTTPIMAYFESLRSRQDLDPQIAQAVDRTSRQVESMMRLVEMVRTVARVRDEAPNLHAVDVEKALHASIKEIRDKSKRDDIEFELDLPKEPVMVRGDEMIEDIFMNLFYSVAMPDKETKTNLMVSIESRKDHKMEFWWVKMAQASRAIPNNLKGEVLRLAKTSKSELTSGFGIGLAAAKGVVERYSGTMWVSDIVQGDYTKGCVFNIML